jgi:hypothetical protein
MTAPKAKAGARWSSAALFGAALGPRLNAPEHHKPRAIHPLAETVKGLLA